MILSDRLVMCAEICMINKIRCSPNHALEAALPRVRVPARLTRLAVTVHSRYLDVPRCRTGQFGRSFVTACVQFSNSLDKSCFAGDGIAAFKSQLNRALLFGISLFPFSSTLSNNFQSY